MPSFSTKAASADVIAGHVAPGNKGNLVPQIGELVVHGCGREEQHLRADARRDDVFHQPLVAAAADLLVARPLHRLGVVAEVVRLVDDDKVVCPPVQRGKLDAVGIARIAGKVGMVQHVEAKAVGGERVERAVGAIDRPVASEFLGAEHQHPLVAQLEILDDRKPGIGLSQADAIGEDAAVAIENLVDGGLGAVLSGRKTAPARFPCPAGRRGGGSRPGRGCHPGNRGKDGRGSDNR